MALKSASDIAVRMNGLVRAVSGPEQRKRMAAVGKAVAPLAARAARSDLGGDAAFSGWRRGAPIPLGARATVHKDGMGVTIGRTRTSAGPWRVAEDGRNRGHSGVAGPAINRRTGATTRTKTGNIRATRYRGGSARTRRNNGTTSGKNTWSDAEAIIRPAATKAITTLNRRAVLDAFRGKK